MSGTGRGDDDVRLARQGVEKEVLPRQHRIAAGGGREAAPRRERQAPGDEVVEQRGIGVVHRGVRLVGIGDPLAEMRVLADLDAVAIECRYAKERAAAPAAVTLDTSALAVEGAFRAALAAGARARAGCVARVRTQSA